MRCGEVPPSLVPASNPKVPLPATFRWRLFAFWVLSVVLLVVGWTWRPTPATPAVVPTIHCSVAEEHVQFATSLPGRLADRVLFHNEDSWRAMRAALSTLREQPERPLYPAIFARCIKFQYPPSSLLLLDGFGTLLGAIGTSNTFLNTLSYLLLGLMLAVTWRIYMGAVGRRGRPSLLDHATPLLSVLTAYPVLKSVELGQIQTWLNGLFAASVLLFMSGRSLAAGLLLGLMATIKPQMALFLPWALVRKDWPLAAGLGACAGLIGLVSLARYGLGPHLEYLGVLSSISRHGEAYFANQSFNGLLLRAMHLGSNLYFDRSGFAPYHPLVRYGTLATSLLIIGYAMKVGAKSGRATAGLSLCLAATCFTIASPIAWEHHYGILPVAFAVCLASLVQNGEQLRLPWVLLALAWVLTAVRFAATQALHASWLNVLQSHVYIGAILLIVTLRVHSVSLQRRARSGHSA